MMVASPEPLRKTPSQVDIARYAAATNDYTPIHLDAEHARSVGLPGAIAHGLLSLGYVGQLLTDWAGGDPSAVRRTRLRFLELVQPGDHLVVEVTAIRDRAPFYDVDIAVMRGGDVVVAGDATVELSVSRLDHEPAEG